jgi:hypothetical protein
MYVQLYQKIVNPRRSTTFNMVARSLVLVVVLVLGSHAPGEAGTALVKLVVRDFTACAAYNSATDTCSNGGHPDFERFPGNRPNQYDCVENFLEPDTQKPILKLKNYTDPKTRLTTVVPKCEEYTSAKRFDQWYSKSTPGNVVEVAAATAYPAPPCPPATAPTAPRGAAERDRNERRDHLHGRELFPDSRVVDARRLATRFDLTLIVAGPDATIRRE